MTEITDKNGPCVDTSGLALRSAAPLLGGRAVDRPASGLADHRFRDLLPSDAWDELPEVVQRRFSKRLADGASRFYTGEVAVTRLSAAGWVLAALARLVGGPLPCTDGATGPATVLVVEDHAHAGQIWTRTYARPGRFPQTINSVKRFAGPTGLEEYLGYGMVMRLVLSVDSGALVFASAGYDIVLGRRRIALPAWLSPGRCTITHRAEGAERFSFTLALDHPRLGRLAYQVAHFTEVEGR